MSFGPVALGQTALKTLPVGVGTMAWGDQVLWGYGKNFSHDDVKRAFQASLDAGVTLFDTAEIYSMGASERLLGELVRSQTTPLIIASKYAPLPWRTRPAHVRKALAGSLQRLGVSRIDLYQVHWPFSLLSIYATLNALADLVQEGMIGAVGVSNYSAEQVRRAHAILSKRGIDLATVQVEYNLLKRSPETNNMLFACRDHGITLLAYSPLALGLLTGKYSVNNLPSGPRRLLPRFQRSNLEAIAPVIGLLTEIGQANHREPAQVALNWLHAHSGAIPIPGAKNEQQARINAASMDFTLMPDQIDAIDKATATWKK